MRDDLLGQEIEPFEVMIEGPLNQYFLAATEESQPYYLEGKAAPDYQAACIGLAKKGIVVLIFDPMGLSLKPTISTTRVSPSQRPTESPSHAGSKSSG